MLEYADFYNIAYYGNKNWKGCFNQKEVACNAYDYKIEYDTSIDQGRPTHTMIELCKLLYEDMQGKMPSVFTLASMINILADWKREH